MTNIKTAIDNARRDHPDFLLIDCMELDNGVLFTGKTKGAKEVTYGAVGLYSSSTTPDTKFVPMAFVIQHDKYGGKRIDISRFQTPEERKESFR